jgi:hypothetical protein
MAASSSMTRAEVLLTDEEAAAIKRIAAQSARKEEDVIHFAIELLIGQRSTKPKLDSLRAARGIWQDRTDLPDARQMRAKFDRF